MISNLHLFFTTKSNHNHFLQVFHFTESH